MSNESPNYRMPMPARQGERGSSGSVGHQRMPVTRSGVHTQATPPPKESASKTTMQPGPVNPPNYADDQNGMKPLAPLPSNPQDAQSEACDQPELEQTTAPPGPVPTSATPPEGGGESDPVPGAADPGATGAAAKPGYASLLNEEQNHPRGYSGE